MGSDCDRQRRAQHWGVHLPRYRGNHTAKVNESQLCTTPDDFEKNGDGWIEISLATESIPEIGKGVGKGNGIVGSCEPHRRSAKPRNDYFLNYSIFAKSSGNHSDSAWFPEREMHDFP